MADREKKRGRIKYKKLEYLENRRIEVMLGEFKIDQKNQLNE